MRGSTNTAVAWLLAIAWGGFIWGLGSDDFSMDSTSRVLGPLVDWLSPNWTDAQKQWALVALRKLAHVGEYALFALLVGRAVALGSRLRMRFVAISALAAVCLLAVADEARQAISQMRTGSPSDVLLDISGGLLALGLWFTLRRWLRLPLYSRPDRPRARPA